MNRLTAFLFLALVALSVCPRPAAAEEKSGREKLGLRLGYVHSASDIKIQFGHGSVVQLHFTEKIKPPLFVTISLGALYLGKSASDNITQFLFGPGVSDANMRILTMTLGPTLELPIYDKGIVYLSGGAGLYSISVLLEMGIFASDKLDAGLQFYIPPYLDARDRQGPVHLVAYHRPPGPVLALLLRRQRSQFLSDFHRRRHQLELSPSFRISSICNVINQAGGSWNPPERSAADG